MSLNNRQDDTKEQTDNKWSKQRENLTAMAQKYPNTLTDIIDAAYLAGLEAIKVAMSFPRLPVRNPPNQPNPPHHYKPSK